MNALGQPAKWMEYANQSNSLNKSGGGSTPPPTVLTDDTNTIILTDDSGTNQLTPS